MVSFEGEKGKKDGEKKGGNGWPENAGGYGANVAAGDLDGDGKDEILVGAGPDPKKNGQVAILYNRESGYAAESFTAYEESRFGVCLSSEDVDGDGVAEILTGPGPDPKSKAIVRIFLRDGTMVEEFQAYPDSVGFGVMISKGTVGE